MRGAGRQYGVPYWADISEYEARPFCIRRGDSALIDIVLPVHDAFATLFNFVLLHDVGSHALGISDKIVPRLPTRQTRARTSAA